jgi:hypothetical protein
MLADKEDAQMNAEIGKADSRTSLEQLLPLLQRSPAAALADAGLTLLGAEQLMALRRLALHQAELCDERRDLLQCLAWYCVEYGRRDPSRSRGLRACAAHIAMLEQESQRWLALAENAKYYQQHPGAAEAIAHRLPRDLPVSGRRTRHIL